MRLSDYLREDLILHDLEAKDAPEALKVFGDLFQKAGHIASGEEVTRALIDREVSHTTCLGRGIALPHASVPGLPNPLILVATATPPVPFGTSPEADTVDLFFVLLSPPGRQGEHIKLLARICRLAQHPEDLEEVRTAPDAGALFRAILRLDSRHV